MKLDSDGRNFHTLQLLQITLLAVMLSEVSGLKLSFTRDKIIRGNFGETQLTCDVTEDVSEIIIMQVRVFDHNIWRTIALLDKNGLSEVIGLEDFENRITVNGLMNTTDPNLTSITVTFNESAVRCSDGTIYECSITYITRNFETATNRTSASLQVYMFPNATSLEAKLNGVQLYESTLTRPASMKVGDTLELTCTANIGSVASTLIQWRMTTDTCTATKRVEYKPRTENIKEDSVTYDGECGYIRQTTLTYHVNTSEVKFELECYVHITDAPYDNFQTSNNPKFFATLYIEQDRKDDDLTNTSCNYACTCTEASGTNTAVILAVVFGTLSVLLVVYSTFITVMLRRSNKKEHTKQKFLHYRQNSRTTVSWKGECYPCGLRGKRVSEDNSSNREINDYDYLSCYSRTNSAAFNTTANTVEFARIQSTCKTEPSDVAVKQNVYVVLEKEPQTPRSAKPNEYLDLNIAKLAMNAKTKPKPSDYLDLERGNCLLKVTTQYDCLESEEGKQHIKLAGNQQPNVRLGLEAKTTNAEEKQTPDIDKETPLSTLTGDVDEYLCPINKNGNRNDYLDLETSSNLSLSNDKETHYF